MKLRQWLVAIIALLGVNVGVMAQSDQVEKSSDRGKNHVYIGADFSFYNNLELEVESISIDDSSDLSDFGYSAVVGYEFDTHKVVKIGGEGEYRDFGKVNYFNELDVKGDGIFLNVKPKFIVLGEHADAYVSLLAGIGSMDIEGKLVSSGLSASKSELGYQFGAELGFIIGSDIDLHVGYRSAHVEIEDIDISIVSGYAGIRYHF
ncbi:outer membrane beta-barrel protein [Vibrio cincinnatiensis]